MGDFDDRAYIIELERIFRRLNYVLFRKGRKTLSEFGITPPQFSTLSTVNYHSGITMGELCEHLYLTSATVTGLVDRLEERGLLVRERDKDDRRVIRLKITKAGKDILEEAVETRRDVLSTYIDKLNCQEKEMLLDLLKKLQENVD